jgi:hypothetical protein
LKKQLCPSKAEIEEFPKEQVKNKYGWLCKEVIKRFIFRRKEEFFKPAVPGVTYAIIADHSSH